MSTFRQNCALFLQSNMMGGKIVGNIFDSKEKQKPGCSGHYSLFKHRKKVLLKKKKKEKNKLDDHPPTFMPHHGMFLQLPPPMKKCRLVFDNKEHQCSDQLTSRGFQQGGCYQKLLVQWLDWPESRMSPNVSVSKMSQKCLN